MVSEWAQAWGGGRASGWGHAQASLWGLAAPLQVLGAQHVGRPSWACMTRARRATPRGAGARAAADRKHPFSTTSPSTATLAAAAGPAGGVQRHHPAHPPCAADHTFPAGKAIWVTGWGHTQEAGEWGPGVCSQPHCCRLGKPWLSFCPFLSHTPSQDCPLPRLPPPSHGGTP